MFSLYRVYKVWQICVASDLDLWPPDLEINRFRPIAISIKCTKFDIPSWNGLVCIVLTSFVHRQTDTRAIPGGFRVGSRVNELSVPAFAKLD